MRLDIHVKTDERTYGVGLSEVKLLRSSDNTILVLDKAGLEALRMAVRHLEAAISKAEGPGV